MELPMEPRASIRRVIGPDGAVLTEANLPSPKATRWVATRKAVVVAAVRGGLLSLDDACQRYRLTPDEFLSWQTQVDRYGLSGLRATHLQTYREHARNITAAAGQKIGI